MKKRHRTSRRQKLAWLRAHPEMRTLPAWSVARAMIRAGLYSPNTRLQDLNVLRLMKEAKLCN